MQFGKIIKSSVFSDLSPFLNEWSTITLKLKNIFKLKLNQVFASVDSTKWHKIQLENIKNKNLQFGKIIKSSVFSDLSPFLNEWSTITLKLKNIFKLKLNQVFASVDSTKWHKIQLDNIKNKNL